MMDKLYECIAVERAYRSGTLERVWAEYIIKIDRLPMRL